MASQVAEPEHRAWKWFMPVLLLLFACGLRHDEDRTFWIQQYSSLLFHVAQHRTGLVTTVKNDIAFPHSGADVSCRTSRHRVLDMFGAVCVYLPDAWTILDYRPRHVVHTPSAAPTASLQEGTRKEGIRENSILWSACAI